MRSALAFATASGLALLIAISPRSLPAATPPILSLEAVHLWKEVRAGELLRISFHLRNASDGVATVQNGSNAGYEMTVAWSDKEGRHVPAEEYVDRDPPPNGTPLASDFEVLPEGTYSRSLRRTPFLCAPKLPGRYVLFFEYRRPRPPPAALGDRLRGAGLPFEVADRLYRSFHGTLRGEIEVLVY